MFESTAILCKIISVDIDIAVFKMEIVDDWCHLNDMYPNYEKIKDLIENAIKLPSDSKLRSCVGYKLL